MNKEVLLFVLQLMATVFGLLQGFLILLKRKENWTFLFAQAVAYMVWALGSSLYADVLEQSVYIILSVLGFSIWYKKFRNKLFSVEIHSLDKKYLGLIFVVIFVLTIAIRWWLLKTNDPYPELDAFTTAIGFVATFLMARKVVECWVLWFVSDILGCIIYFDMSAPALTVLNFVWTFMAIGSFITWYKASREVVRC